MPTSDSGEPRRTPMKPHGVTPIPEQQEQLPCPRCDSTNTKFCYYNNYNFSQPRHFCKSCRRYWTRGGTLRDIPIGGGTRKSAKRSRTCSPRTAPLQPTLQNDPKPSALSLCGTFTSLLNSHNAALTATLGLGGFDDVGFGLGRPICPFSTLADAAITNVGSNAAPMPATWHFDGLESGNSAAGFVSGEYFAWPDLSITTPGNSLK